MKKVKVMLLSLALLAVVGGALAFKAKFNQRFCYTTAFLDNGAYTCTLNSITKLCRQTLVATSEIDPNPFAVTSYCTTEPYQTQIAPGQFVFGCTTDLGGGNITTKDCPIQTTLKGD